MLFDRREIFTEDRLNALWRFASSILSDREEAKDVVQDVVAKVLSRPFPIVNPESYLLRAVRNASIDRLRLKKDFASEMPEIPVENNVEEMNARDIVSYAMNRLNEKERMIVHLKDIEGYSSVEIAAMMGLQDNHVRTILSRARKSMKEIIENELHYGK